VNQILYKKSQKINRLKDYINENKKKKDEDNMTIENSKSLRVSSPEKSPSRKNNKSAPPRRKKSNAPTIVSDYEKHINKYFDRKKVYA
jgi:hypothetical protein